MNGRGEEELQWEQQQQTNKNMVNKLVKSWEEKIMNEPKVPKSGEDDALALISHSPITYDLSPFGNLFDHFE